MREIGSVMCGGKAKTERLIAESRMSRRVYSYRFCDGSETPKVDGNTARVFVKACKSEQFFDWIAGMGTLKIAWLKSLVDECKNYLKALLKD